MKQTQIEKTKPFQDLIMLYEYLLAQKEELEKIRQILAQIEQSLNYNKQDNEIIIRLKSTDKIREETVRDILKLSKKEFEDYKEQGLITPVNKHNYYLVEDVITLKNYIETKQ